MAPPPKLQIFYYHTLVRLNTCELEVLKCLTPNIVEEKLCQLKSILFLIPNTMLNWLAMC
jgi:hypothetical protein